jgi:integrase
MKKSNLLELFSNYLIRNFESEATRKTYYSCAKKFTYSNHPDTIGKLTNDYLLKYLTDYKKDNSVSSYNQMLSVLKILYNSVLNQKKLKSVSPIKQYPKLKNLPDYSDVKAKILAIQNQKHKAILYTLLVTGLRMSELLNVRISDIKRNTMQILIPCGKGGQSAFAILTKSLLIELEKYYWQYKPKNYLFEGMFRDQYSPSSVNNLVKKYLGNKYSAHWLRHIAITYIINQKYSLPQTKLYSRHKSDSSVHFYYHYDESLLNDIRKSIEAA